MGLDQYAYSVERKTGNGDFNIAEDADKAEIYYWRKHNALHAWMLQLYREKGGTAEQFNCVPLRITIDDCNRLLADINSKNLKPMEGFFFGQQLPYDDSDVENDLSFLKMAMVEIEHGREVYYDSWW
jgi:hypothetical protein